MEIVSDAVSERHLNAVLKNQQITKELQLSNYKKKL